MTNPKHFQNLKDIKDGDIIICEEAALNNFIVGKEYTVIRSAKGLLFVRDEFGNYSSSTISTFVKPEEEEEDKQPETVPDLSWDENFRGPKMSKPVGASIFKYPVPNLEEFSVTMPEGAEVLRIDHIEGFTWLWALVDLDEQPVEHRFKAFKTGVSMPKNLTETHDYVGFYPLFIQVELGLYVFKEGV